MSIEVRLPELGESITHARLSVWLKREGDRVNRGDILAEVETDKTSIEIESPADGVLMSVRVPAGTEKVRVHEVLALLEAAGGVSAGPAIVGAEPPGETPRITPVSPAPSPVSVAEAAAQAPALVPADPVGAEPFASPLAKRMAHAAGIPLASIRATGPGGQISRADVDSVLAPTSASAPVRRPAPPVVPSPASPLVASDDESRYDLVTLSPMRRVSAERLTQSKQQIPHFYLRIDCAMDGVAGARAQINAGANGDPLSLTAFTLRAAALALRKVPAANATWADGAVRLYKTVDLAVAVNTPSGLIAPVIRSAEQKSVVALNAEIRALAERARNGKLLPTEYTGGTCTVSNLGMFGVTSLYPIINPPQACILGLGAIEERPVVRDHAPAVGLMMTCTLAGDHRALDGATGAAFLPAFRELIEDPWLLLL